VTSKRIKKAIERAGGRVVEVRTAADLAQCDGLIIPGGESTTMLKLLDQEGLTSRCVALTNRNRFTAAAQGRFCWPAK